jgi:hypothetical protein
VLWDPSHRADGIIVGDEGCAAANTASAKPARGTCLLDLFHFLPPLTVVWPPLFPGSA